TTGVDEVSVVPAADWMERIAGEPVRRRRVRLGVGANLLDDLCRRLPGARTWDAAVVYALCDRAGDVGRSHARTGDRVVAVVEPGRENADAGPRDRVRLVRRGGDEVRKARFHVVGVRRARAAEASW